MKIDTGLDGVLRHAPVDARVGPGGPLDEEVRRGAVALLDHHAHAASGRVVRYDLQERGKNFLFCSILPGAQLREGLFWAPNSARQMFPSFSPLTASERKMGAEKNVGHRSQVKTMLSQLQTFSRKGDRKGRSSDWRKQKSLLRQNFQWRSETTEINLRGRQTRRKVVGRRSEYIAT